MAFGSAVDPNRDTPLYLQIVQQIEASIRSGELGANERLAGEHRLARQYSVSRATIRHAIGHLVDRGILIRQHGVGTQVAPLPPSVSHGISSLYDEMAVRGRHPTTRVIERCTRSAPRAIAEVFEIPEGSPVEYLERLRFVDGQPFGVMRNWVPDGLVSFTASELETRGFYELLRSQGIDITFARQSIGAKLADTELAEALGVEIGSALLAITSTAYADLGRPIEFGSHDYLASQYKFEVTYVAS